MYLTIPCHASPLRAVSYDRDDCAKGRFGPTYGFDGARATRYLTHRPLFYPHNRHCNAEWLSGMMACRWKKYCIIEMSMAVTTLWTDLTSDFAKRQITHPEATTRKLWLTLRNGLTQRWRVRCEWLLQSTKHTRLDQLVCHIRAFAASFFPPLFQMKLHNGLVVSNA